MKKFTTVLCIMFFASVGAFAQGVSGGIKAGLNLSNMTFSSSGYTTSPSFSPALHGGVYLTAMFSEHLGLQPEVLFSGQGYKAGDQKYALNYITVPVLVRYNVNSLLSFHAGPQVGFLMSAKEKVSSTSTDIKDDLKSTDMGVAAGIGIDLPMKLNFSFRFVKGLSNVASNDDNTNDVKAKNYALQFSVGYKLFGK
ncbi:Outer membrane protein beta-barrel domain-containing protein [Chryseolinea serpens]|uniref:Outer membrane protein beta-barrel domain-containing protein n=1 Tax=Chryseolinea serpens TaxID=947013 RepID=A0A1M5LQ79_9BACT|nr:porin family protein [Chryseolinea serpens]SHG67208.1 Outer membrane protein beta-barrel domain-containing protein [Chryseolinea serpens]